VAAPTPIVLRYVTTNEGKAREARTYLDCERLDYEYTEIQSASLEPIAARGAREAHAHAGEPVMVDDAGLFVDALEGFPGPYSAFVEDTLGIERVGALAREAATDSGPPDAAGGEPTVRAAFRCVIAYCDGAAFAAGPDVNDAEAADPATSGAVDRSAEPPVKLFAGAVRGRIVEPRGEGGFGYDPIFEHDGRTFAEMSGEEKNAVSHRGRALAAFAEWYADR
jgi:XTP/dITP diphosphohydrolase